MGLHTGRDRDSVGSRGRACKQVAVVGSSFVVLGSKVGGSNLVPGWVILYGMSFVQD